MNNNFEIQIINNLDDLKDSILFLKKGFSWSNKYAFNLYKSIYTFNKKINFYGFKMIDRESEIIGCILTFYQGSLRVDSKNFKLINLSSWYILSEHRGINSILMLRKVSEMLSSYIITNFSPNKATELILNSIGFKKSEDCTINTYFFKYIYLSLKTFFSKSLSISKIDKSELTLFKDFEFRDSFCINFVCNNKLIKFLLARTNIERKVLFFNLRVPRLNIIWCSDENYFKENFFLIISKFFIQYKVPIISCHNFENKLFRSDNIWRNHFYKASFEFKGSIPVLGSELSVKL